MTDVSTDFNSSGFYIGRNLFTSDEINDFISHYMRLHNQRLELIKNDPHELEPVISKRKEDPLVAFPRMMHMHRWDQKTFDWLTSERLRHILYQIMGMEPLAIMSMLYFKPPGARGQAMHQDQRYVQVHPGTCIGAWMALDPATTQNGCLRVVPGSHKWPLLCPEPANIEQSFVNEQINIPNNVEIYNVEMKPGDVLFFHGSLVHGSLPNHTDNMFRRSLIGHYVSINASAIDDFYMPVIRFDGTEIHGLESSGEGTKCGIWVDKQGNPVIEIIDRMMSDFGND